MIVVNLFAGPGSGKSTTAAYLFACFKNAGIKTELVREVAKDFIYDGRTVQLSRNQFLVSATQYSRLKDLEHSGCDVAVSDSPLVMGLVYAESTHYVSELSSLVQKTNDEFDNINVFVTRAKPYQEFGRLQKENEARLLDAKTYSIGCKEQFGGPYAFLSFGDTQGQSDLCKYLLLHPKITALQ